VYKPGFWQKPGLFPTVSELLLFASQNYLMTNAESLKKNSKKIFKKNYGTIFICHVSLAVGAMVRNRIRVISFFHTAFNCLSVNFIFSKWSWNLLLS